MVRAASLSGIALAFPRARVKHAALNNQAELALAHAQPTLAWNTYVDRAELADIPSEPEVNPLRRTRDLERVHLGMVLAAVPDMRRNDAERVALLDRAQDRLGLR